VFKTSDTGVRKPPEALKKMRAAGRVVAEMHSSIREAIRPGVTTAELDKVARAVLDRRGARSNFLGYGHPPFPAVICASPNDVIVHGIPGPYRLEEGDLISIDVGVTKDGFVADSAYTFAVGDVDPEAQRLMDVCRAALDAGIDEVRAGRRIGDISSAVQSVTESAGFSVVRTLVGHGVGRSMHEEPQIPNFGDAGRGPELAPGMTLAIEPMITAGGPEVYVADDGWSIYTDDGSLAAHFEHTVAATDDGPLVLTASERLAARPPVGCLLP
jgi:methionyl aminopeptidase